MEKIKRGNVERGLEPNRMMEDRNISVKETSHTLQPRAEKDNVQLRFMEIQSQSFTKEDVYKTTQHPNDRRAVLVDSPSEAVAHARLHQATLGETRYIAANLNDAKHRTEVAAELSHLKDKKLVIALSDKDQAKIAEGLAQERGVAFVTVSPGTSWEKLSEQQKQREPEQSR